MNLFQHPSHTISRMQFAFITVLAIRALTVPNFLCAKTFPGATWDSISPDAAGWNKEGLEVAHRFADKIGSSAVLIVQSGKIVSQWGPIDRPFTQHSVRKSFMSALYGIYVEEKEIDPFSTLAALGIDDRAPSLTEAERQATVIDLLESRSGVYHDAAYETEEQKKFRPARGSHPPGAFWFYNNWDFNALETIFKQRTGLTVYEAFEKRIAKPIQMEDYQAAANKLWLDPQSIHAAYPFLMTARDAARFGLLFLNHGRWKSTQVIPANWVEKSTGPISEAGSPDISYGYLWWVAPGERQFGVFLGKGSFSARGSGGNFILVAPAFDIVVVHEGDKEHGKFVSEGDFGGLVRRIMNAAPAARRP
jgi:CubicO group peptidase (beta-lactamase class C family)